MQKQPSIRNLAVLVAALSASTVVSGCTYAAVISRPGENQARIVHRSLFNDQVMHCTATDPTNPVCRVMEEKP